jgi:hypothetical protein
VLDVAVVRSLLVAMLRGLKHGFTRNVTTLLGAAPVVETVWKVQRDVWCMIHRDVKLFEMEKARLGHCSNDFKISKS